LAERLLELIADVQGLLDLPELRLGLLESLMRVVACDWASLNEIGPSPADAVVLTRPVLSARWQRLFAELALDNPLLVRWTETRDGRAYRFSDVASWEELAQRPLFRRVYAPLGVRYQIAFTLPSATDRVLAIALSRREQDFSDDERELLDRARPFLIQAYRNALRVQELDDQAGPSRQLLIEEGLSQRQAEIVVRVARGASNRDIGHALDISERTVAKHLQLAFRVLGVRTRSEAADHVWALNFGRRSPATRHR
jgi:DNA-binding CsgD family transcriptional regulator